MENNDLLVDLVIPIYNLRKHRYNNFCYLIQKLSETSFEKRRCNIVVCEQASNSTSNVEKFLTQYTNISHHIVDNGQVFNKSVVINHAFDNTTSEFFWMCDCDIVFNFKYVVDNIDISSDFVRPFEYVVPLDETESEYYMNFNKLKNPKQKYVSNNCTGKYSFIVSRDTFDSVGRMNEDYEGWGFQDLDFSENRMKDYTPKVISGIAYHLYHEPASRKYINRNRRLYMNLGGFVEYSETTCAIMEDSVKSQELDVKKELSVVKELPTPVVETILEVNPPMEKIKWDLVDKHIVCHRINKSNIFNLKPTESTIYNESEINTATISVLNRMDITQHYNSYLYWYISYIVDNYKIHFPEVVIFLNDMYLRTKQQFESTNYRNILRFLKIGPSNIKVNNYIAGKSKYRITRTGHFAGDYTQPSHHTYAEWCKKYLNDDDVSGVRCVGPSLGCIMVPRDILLKRSYDFYCKLLSDIKRGTDEDHVYCSASLGKIFT